MKCSKCGVDIEVDDNFCWKCGHFTANGYRFLKDSKNVEKIQKGQAIKKENRFIYIFAMMGITTILFVGTLVIKGADMFKPIFFIKRQVENYFYGYNTAMIDTDRTYENIDIASLEEAHDFIERDLEGQEWKCSHDLNTFLLETSIEKNCGIKTVNFCDISYDEAIKIKNVIEEVYELFPNTKGALTNITITNAKTKHEYIAFFQPRSGFVNSLSNVPTYNRVNKTQILLNSYYYLNDSILSKPMEETTEKNWYVEGATWESVIAHELAHYFTFVSFLRKNGLNDITFITAKEVDRTDALVEEFDTGVYARAIVEEALERYRASQNIYEPDAEEILRTISNYAVAKASDGSIIYAETIAEAVHDYYLHRNDANTLSREIVAVLKERLAVS